MNLYGLIYHHPQLRHRAYSVVVAENLGVAKELARRDAKNGWWGYEVVAVKWLCAIEYQGVAFLAWEPGSPEK